MKFDYLIKWHSVAEEKLRTQARYILQQSQNRLIAEYFYDAVKSEIDKLSYTADVYRLRKKKEIPLLNGKYIVKFLSAHTPFISSTSNPQNNNIIPPRSVQLVARKNTHKNHCTSFRTEVESFVHQDARYDME